MPALFGVLFGLVPAHFLLRQLGRSQWYWYAGAGALAGIASIAVLRPALGYLAFFADTEGVAPLLIAAAVGGPVGALLFRRLLRPGSPLAVPKPQPIREK